MQAHKAIKLEMGLKAMALWLAFNLQSLLQLLQGPAHTPPAWSVAALMAHKAKMEKEEMKAQKASSAPSLPLL